MFFRNLGLGDRIINTMAGDKNCPLFTKYRLEVPVPLNTQLISFNYISVAFFYYMGLTGMLLTWKIKYYEF